MKDKVKGIIGRRLPKRKRQTESLEQSAQGIPRITNDTVAEHREEVLSSARKYIYPLQHSAHRVVIISISLLIFMIIAFFTYCLLALYKFQSSSTFLYRITQVIPFPVAKAGPRYVAYENYLFELRHYTHYYQTQQRVDFGSDSGREQLAEFRKRAMDRVITNAYAKQLAKKHDISVSEKELEKAIDLVRSQNRLGSNDQVFEDVLTEFWGWSVSDFKRELKQQLLAQKGVSTLDIEAHERIAQINQRLQSGEDFGLVAGQNSDDTITRGTGGNYGFAIGPSDRNLPPQVIDALFKLEPGQVSGVINTGTGLEILKLNQRDGTKVQASHILVNFKPLDTYIKPLRDKAKPRLFIKP